MSVYEEYGLRPIINCIGSMTSLGGSVMHPQAVEAMRRAAQSFVDLNGLLQAAGRRAARLARAPPGYDAHIVTGAAAGIAYCVAACLTASPSGIDAAKVAALPCTAGFGRSEVIIDGGSDRRWERAAALTGARVVPLGTEAAPMTAAALEAALKRGAACCVLYFSCGDEEGQNGKAPLSEVLALGCAHGVPVIIDAAARVPPRSNLWRFTEMGADAVIFSGGKAMRGPQTSGMIVGREWLIAAARANGSPHEPTVCRPMKCAKEDVCGFVAALEAFVSGDDDAELAEWGAMAARIGDALRDAPGVKSARVVCPGPPDVQPNHIPRLYVDLDTHGGAPQAGDVEHGSILDVLPTTPPTDLVHRLVSGNPIVAVMPHPGGIVVSPQLLSAADEGLVTSRIAAALAAMVAEGKLRPRGGSGAAPRSAPY